MRPRKRILIIDKDDDRTGQLRFLLDVHSFAVFACASVSARPDQWVELVIVVGDVEARVYDQAKRVILDTPLLAIRDALPKREIASPDRILIAPSAFEILQTIKNITARKRGPKPGRKALLDRTPTAVATA